MPTYREQIQELINDPERLLKKKPFFRGYSIDSKMCPRFTSKNVELNALVDACLPKLKKHVISQEQFLMELEPSNHKVLYDKNIPSIYQKLDNGSYLEVEYKRMAVSYQKNILDKQVLHLCGYPMQFTIMDTNPTDKQKEDFSIFKQYWDLRNQDGMREKMVETQLSMGDAGLLYYYDRQGRVKSRLLSFDSGFILCPHNDNNGDRLLESVYYMKDDVEYIDSYDDTFMYRHIREYDTVEDKGWRLVMQEPHNFPEIPLITKRGRVAWDDAQDIIEVYEIIYNIFLVIQKRHGWGILYIKGQFDDTGKRVNGSVILNSKTALGKETNSDDAKFLTPPTPQGMLDTLQLMEETIQKNSSTNFILPKDIKSSGDISGTAILLSLSMDIERALKNAIEWQNVADKMCRLFKAGLAKELVATGVNPSAVTDFDNLNINAKFKVWRPQSETEITNRLNIAKSAGFMSVQSATENNPDSKPDEFARIENEKLLERERQFENQERQLAMTAKYSEKEEESNNNNSNNKEE